MEDEIEVPLDLTGLKKKKKKLKKESTKQNDDEQDYTYTELLGRLYKQLKESGNYKEKKSKLIIPPPQLSRYGGKRTLWTNFAIISERMSRLEDHLMSFVLAELSTSGSLTGDRSLNIYGRFRQNNIEQILRNYIGIYVRCKNCRSHDTFLKKDKQTRLTFLCCPCGAQMNCPPTKR